MTVEEALAEGRRLRGPPYRMTIEYPLLPLAVALPRMLEQIEADLAVTPSAAEKWRLRRRAELVRELLAPASVSN